MEFPSGVLGVDMITAGGIRNAYRLPEGQRWNTRVAWRTVPNPDPDLYPTAVILVQFWPTGATAEDQ